VTVGVPVGSPEYVKKHLSSRLFDSGLWQFAWQLRGMVESHLLEALLLRGSLTRRFGFLVRNVDPGVGKEHFSSYGDFCVWAFENLLHVQGVVSAASMQQSLSQACAEGDPDISRSGLGPIGLANSPLAMAYCEALQHLD
jgi:hypothetical protein